MKYVGVYIDHYSRCSFFLRLSDTIDQLNYKTVIFTCKLSIYLAFKYQGKETYLISHISNQSVYPQVEKSSDVLKGQQSIKTASDVYASTLGALFKIDQEFQIDIFCIWNGASSCDIAIADFAKQKNKKLLYFEIANLPGKMFIDPKGVNALSYLYENPAILDRLPIDEAEFKRWRQSVFYKGKNLPPKQAKFIRKLNFFALIDRIGFHFFNAQRIDQTPWVSQLKHFGRRRVVQLKYDSFDLSQPYVFLPLQVCNDTQLLLNSDYNNEQAIIEAKQAAQELHLPLVVKPHPAEDDALFLIKLRKLRNQYNFFLVSCNTIDLVKNADLIVVNNSTVGLEALIMDKKIKILGRTFYRHFDRKRLISYIQNYLVDCDYFAPRKIPISPDIIQACLDRADFPVQ